MDRPRTESQPRGEVDFHARAPGSLRWSPHPARQEAEDVLVTSAFRHLLGPGTLTNASARDLGRAMARAMSSPSMVETCDVACAIEAFSHLGIGHLRLTGQTEGHFAFEGVDLVGSDRAGSGACAMTLGFLEGVASVLTGRPAMGAEMRCRARGHETCQFVVRSRA